MLIDVNIFTFSAEKTSQIDARLIDNFSLYQVIEDLRHHFNSPDMNLALPLPRYVL